MKEIALSLREIKCKNKRKRREKQKNAIAFEFSCVKKNFQKERGILL